MIVYASTKAGFNQDVLSNQIEAKILADFYRTLGRGTGASEIRSWKSSLLYMNNILTDPAIPDDAGVAIEKEDIALRPCAYLHNYIDNGVINSEFYQAWRDILSLPALPPHLMICA